MSTHYWQQQIRRMEEALLDAIPPDLHHVDDGTTRMYDAEFATAYTTTAELPIIGRAVIEPGTPTELKTCQQWIDDAGSRAGRRRGRWQAQQATHEVLVEKDGVYALLVMDRDNVLAGRIVPAKDLGKFASWTNGGSRYDTARAYIPWSKVIDPDSVDG